MSVETVLKIVRKIVPNITDDIPWYGKLGEGITEEKIQALVNAGYGYVIQGGSLTTPITGAGAYVSTTPDMDILVPTNKAFIPLVVNVGYEIIGTSLLLEVIVLAGVGGTQGATTAVTPTNMNTAIGNESGLICRSPSTGAVLPTERLTDISHDQETLAITKTAGSATVAAFDRNKYIYRAKDEGVYHVLQAGNNLQARLNVWGASQGPTLFITVKGLSVPVAWVNA